MRYGMQIQITFRGIQTVVDSEFVLFMRGHVMLLRRNSNFFPSPEDMGGRQEWPAASLPRTPLSKCTDAQLQILSLLEMSSETFTLLPYCFCA